MNLLRRINRIRGYVMRAFTDRIGNTKSELPLDSGKKIEVNSILITRPNHRLGNQMLITPLLKEMERVFPNSRIDLLVKGDLGKAIFKNFGNVNKVIQLPKRPFNNPIAYINGWMAIRSKRYDLVINATNNSSSGRLSTKFANAQIRLFGDVSEEIKNKYEDYDHMAKRPVYTFREQFRKLGFTIPDAAIEPLDLKLDEQELADGKRWLEEKINNTQKTICLFTYATGPKRFDSSWWLIFYERLKSEFPYCNIIEILPVENVSQIGLLAPTFKDPSIRKVASLIANTNVWIGADSGLMHLATASGGPTGG
ncbi:MAG TPA: glycosyltransferase family 9 protein, partial [Cyclobacteriaceae bacterium]|nr:glycosyltransferase family 9 protein [Cyclobacteriaceae bacterium]